MALAFPRLGEYRIIRRIGKGGMGEVYEAESTRLERRVAIKVLLAEHGPTSRAAQRFYREARAASRIAHPNVVAVFDFGSAADGRLFMVMEFLEGQTLADHLRAIGALGVRETQATMLQVLQGLSAAHRIMVVHRDLKPANVFLTKGQRSGTVAKLLDFGLSKSLEDAFGGVLTSPGAVVGTPLYLAPEQAVAGGTVDGRSDLWAVGVMLYQCLTGLPPFRAKNYRSLVDKILNDTPAPPTTLRPSIPKSLEAIILQALQRNPGDRFQSAVAMASALRNISSPDVG